MPDGPSLIVVPPARMSHSPRSCSMPSDARLTRTESCTPTGGETAGHLRRGRRQPADRGTGRRPVHRQVGHRPLDQPQARRSTHRRHQGRVAHPARLGSPVPLVVGLPQPALACSSARLAPPAPARTIQTSRWNRGRRLRRHVRTCRRLGPPRHSGHVDHHGRRSGHRATLRRRLPPTPRTARSHHLRRPRDRRRGTCGPLRPTAGDADRRVRRPAGRRAVSGSRSAVRCLPRAKDLTHGG